MVKAIPLVSIVITSFNRAQWIGKAIESALAQDYSNLEIVVSDNCSTDGSHEVIQAYTKDPRIKYSRQDVNIGMLPNFKKASEELAAGEYISFLSSDDYFTYPKFISDAVQLVNNYPDVVIVFGKGQDLDDVTKKIRKDQTDFYKVEFRKGQEAFLEMVNEDLSFAGIFFRRNTFVSLDVFSHVGISGLDVLANLTMMLHGNAAYIDKYCYMMRHHQNNAHNRLSAEFYINELKIINIPYENAIKSELIETHKLEKWHTDILVRFITIFFRRLYLSNRQEFVLFSSYIKKFYEPIFRTIDDDRTWKRYKMFYRYPSLTYNPLRYVWNLYKEIRYK
ncbi:MAG: glycosyltransferase family 2 protein [Flavobacterium sp.]|nr:MAG: glycosyltransferase family 2 protein [Flavobacterium sp.]